MSMVVLLYHHFGRMLIFSMRQGSADDRSKFQQKCQKLSKLFNLMSKIVKIVQFHEYIWNLHEKCIQMSTNMPSIGLVIRERCFEIGVFCGNKIPLLGQISDGVKSVNYYISVPMLFMKGAAYFVALFPYASILRPCSLREDHVKILIITFL